MMKTLRMIALRMTALVVAALVLVGPGWGADDAVYDRVMREKKLRVYAIQFPPLSYREGNDEWKGIDADIYRYLANRMGVELEVVWTSTAAMVPTITSGRAEMGTALYQTAEREKVLDFTAPYKWIGDHIVVHADDVTTKTIEDLKGKVLGVVRGTAEEPAARKMQENGYLKEVRVYESNDAVYMDLNVKRIDGLMNATLYHQYFQAQNSNLKTRLAFEVDPKYFGRTSRSPSALPVTKGATKLVERVNGLIAEMRQNGEMTKIFGRYGITEPSVWMPPR